MQYLLEEQFIIIMRVIMALLLGILIGIDRQKRKTETNNHGAAGLRTHALVCVGTTLITAVGILIFPDDPIRLASSIMAGIGFIGAGTIMASEKKIMGLTNAASIWAIAAIGIACGAGLYLVASFGAMITLIVLQLRKFERLE
jgi:putative Mg2+ transporter-C (MgtC) family protein